jgi:beta-lactamase regulating signal transducer with metallopeptidase domain
MKLPGFSTLKSVLPVIALLLVPAAIPVMAQSDSSGAPATTQSSGSQSTSRQSASTTTRTEVQPVQNATRVDPMWLIIGGAAVIALLIIVVLAMRGRDTDTVSRVSERTTVIKE